MANRDEHSKAPLPVHNAHMRRVLWLAENTDFPRRDWRIIAEDPMFVKWFETGEVDIPARPEQCGRNWHDGDCCEESRRQWGLSGETDNPGISDGYRQDHEQWSAKQTKSN